MHNLLVMTVKTKTGWSVLRRSKVLLIEVILGISSLRVPAQCIWEQVIVIALRSLHYGKIVMFKVRFNFIDCLLTVNQPWKLNRKPVLVATFVAVNEWSII